MARKQLNSLKEIVALFHAVLPMVDDVLTQANVPLSNRSVQAFDLIQKTMLKVSDYEKFMLSEEHGRLRIIVSEWFKDRYGDIDSKAEEGFATILVIHGTPFLMRVPSVFRTNADEPNMFWIGHPARVQDEEDPIEWTDCAKIIKNLSQAEEAKARQAAMETANQVRSVGFDLRALQYKTGQGVGDLAGAIHSDLQASAQHLCERSDAGLRGAGWDASQATEKALKLAIRRKGEIPPHSHDLEKLSAYAESLGVQPIDRTKLRAIPSAKSATDMRYGGEFKLANAIAAYEAALSIVRDLLFEVTPNVKYNIRNARFKLHLPWFEFDTESFRTQLRAVADELKQD